MSEWTILHTFTCSFWHSPHCADVCETVTSNKTSERTWNWNTRTHTHAVAPLGFNARVWMSTARTWVKTLRRRRALALFSVQTRTSRPQRSRRGKGTSAHVEHVSEGFVLRSDFPKHTLSRLPLQLRYRMHPKASHRVTMSEHFVTFDSVTLWSLYSIFFTTSSVKGEQHVCTSVKLVWDETHVTAN